MVRFIEVVETPAGFSLEEVWINESHVVRLRSESAYKRLLKEGQLPKDLDLNHDFTSITVTMIDSREKHIVVGDVATIATKLNYDTRTLLKG